MPQLNFRERVAAKRSIGRLVPRGTIGQELLGELPEANFINDNTRLKLFMNIRASMVSFPGGLHAIPETHSRIGELNWAVTKDLLLSKVILFDAQLPQIPPMFISSFSSIV